MKEARHGDPTPDPRSVRRPRDAARRRHRVHLLPARGARRPDRSRGPAGHGQDPARERCSATPAAASSREADVETLLAWRPGVAAEAEIPFMPARVLLQDFTGVPAVVDLAVMRDAMADLGGDPARVNPLVPADLVIDHSVQVDRFGTPGAFAFNVEREYDRNGERYQLLRWAQTRLPRPARRATRDRHRPPGQPRVPGHGRRRSTGRERPADGLPGHGRRAPTRTRRWSTAWACWAMASAGSRPRRSSLASRSTSRCRTSSGSSLHGSLPRGSTATDLVLVVTELLRAHGVVGSFVEFAGDGLADAGPRRPGDDQQHEPRVRGDVDALPDRRRDDRVPAPDRAIAGAAGAGRAIRQDARAVARAGGRRRLRRAARAGPRQRRSVGRRAAPAAGPGPADRAARQLPVQLPERPRRRARATPSRRRAGRRGRDRGGRLGGLVPGLGRTVVHGRRGDRRRGAAGRRRRGRGAEPDRPAPTGRSRSGSASAIDLDPDRLGGDRGDHVVHQHLQPDGHGRRRPARAQRGRPRPARRARRSRPRWRPARARSPATSRRPG